MIEQPIAAAILDITLAEANVYPVAERLRAKGIPFFFASGAEAYQIVPAFKDVPCTSRTALIRSMRYSIRYWASPSHRARSGTSRHGTSRCLGSLCSEQPGLHAPLRITLGRAMGSAFCTGHDIW